MKRRNKWLLGSAFALLGAASIGWIALRSGSGDVPFSVDALRHK